MQCPLRVPPGHAVVLFIADVSDAAGIDVPGAAVAMFAAANVVGLGTSASVIVGASTPGVADSDGVGRDGDGSAAICGSVSGSRGTGASIVREGAARDALTPSTTPETKPAAPDTKDAVAPPTATPTVVKGRRGF